MTHFTVSTAVIRVLKQYAERQGVDFADLAASVGLTPAIIGDDHARISARQFERLWERIIAGGHEPHPGLQFGREMVRHFPGGSILFTLMINCPTIGEALAAFVRYHRIMSDAIQPRIHHDGPRVRLTWDLYRQGFRAHPVLSEALISTYYAILTHLSQGRIIPNAVHFTHPGPEDADAYRRVFNAPISFGAAENALMVDAAAMRLEICLASQSLCGILENHAAQVSDAIGRTNKWSLEVMQVIGGMVMKGSRPTIDAVARRLAVSRRTLQVRLKGEGTTYRDCRERVRKQIACNTLDRPDVAIGEVAFLLGYSEQSAFNHAFRRWTGMRPRDYRRRSSGSVCPPLRGEMGS